MEHLPFPGPISVRRFSPLLLAQLHPFSLSPFHSLQWDSGHRRRLESGPRGFLLPLLAPYSFHSLLFASCCSSAPSLQTHISSSSPPTTFCVSSCASSGFLTCVLVAAPFLQYVWTEAPHAPLKFWPTASCFHPFQSKLEPAVAAQGSSWPPPTQASPAAPATKPPTQLMPNTSRQFRQKS